MQKIIIISYGKDSAGYFARMRGIKNSVGVDSGKNQRDALIKCLEMIANPHDLEIIFEKL